MPSRTIYTHVQYYNENGREITTYIACSHFSRCTIQRQAIAQFVLGRVVMTNGFTKSVFVLIVYGCFRQVGKMKIVMLVDPLVA